LKDKSGSEYLRKSHKLKKQVRFVVVAFLFLFGLPFMGTGIYYASAFQAERWQFATILMFVGLFFLVPALALLMWRNIKIKGER
jgi:uncharacterized membrane protein